ncbi:MAG: hypothetical protein WCG27_05970 [Pseudomonadota bacterium]
MKSKAMKILIIGLGLWVAPVMALANDDDGPAANMKTNLKKFYTIYNTKYYFSAAEHAKICLTENSTKDFDGKFEKSLEDIVTYTGTESFMDFDPAIMAKYNSPTLSFILALQSFKNGRYKDVRSYAAKIPSDHKFGAEALFVLGSSLNLVKDYAPAKEAYEKCVSVADTAEGKQKNEKIKRYYSIIKESCVIHQARMHFKKKEFELAIQKYEVIGHQSYMWPYILLEKAWASYSLGDYNRALGLLVTYKSPLLDSYFFPESEWLMALSYHRLCLWNDTLQVVNQYYQVYKSRSDELREMLNKNQGSDDYFINLMIAPIESVERQNPYIHNLVTQIRKKIKFNLDSYYFEQARKELAQVQKLKDKNLSLELATLLQEVIKHRKVALNHLVKKQMFDFINEIHKYSYDLFQLKLEVVSQQRDLLYRDKQLISDRGRGSYANVNRRVDQYMWDFRGEFWADELGYYSFGLKSNCSEVKKEVKKVKEGEEAQDEI